MVVPVKSEKNIIIRILLTSRFSYSIVQIYAKICKEIAKRFC